MIKAKNYTTHNWSWKWHRNSIKKPQSQRWEFVKGIDPKSPSDMHFAKMHNKKGLKKRKANNSKVMSTCAEAVQALVKHNEVKPKLPKGGSHPFHQHSYITHPKLNTPACITLPRASASAGQRPMVGLKAQAAALALAPRGAQAPMRTIV